MKRWSDFFTDNSTGGAPFFNQDFYDIQQEFYDAINPTIQNLGKQITSDGNYVVDGLEVTPNGSDWDIAAGIVSLGGELYRFNGATAVTSGTKYLAIAANVIENRNYKNGGSKPFFLTKEAEVLSSTSGGAEIVFDPSDTTPFLTLSNTNITEVNNSAGVIEKQNQTVINTYVVDIGSWDMDADQNKTVALTGIDGTKIVNYSVTIFNDGAGLKTSAGKTLQVPSGPAEDLDIYHYLTSSVSSSVTITRRTGGSFDTTGFNDPAANRGKILLWVEE